MWSVMVLCWDEMSLFWIVCSLTPIFSWSHPSTIMTSGAVDFLGSAVGMLASSPRAWFTLSVSLSTNALNLAELTLGTFTYSRPPVPAVRGISLAFSCSMLLFTIAVLYTTIYYTLSSHLINFHNYVHSWEGFLAQKRQKTRFFDKKLTNVKKAESPPNVSKSPKDVEKTCLSYRTNDFVVFLSWRPKFLIWLVD